MGCCLDESQSPELMRLYEARDCHHDLIRSHHDPRTIDACYKSVPLVVPCGDAVAPTPLASAGASKRPALRRPCMVVLSS